MPYYIRNTASDIDFISDQGVTEYLEDELSKLPPAIMEFESAQLLFACMRENKNLVDIKEVTKQIDWASQPFELQSIAVGLKLFKTDKI